MLSVDGEDVRARVVLVGNNAYSIDLMDIGERARIDEGLLYLYITHGLMPGSWEERSGVRFGVDTGSHRVHAAIDGEPAVLPTPLEFTIEPRALRVMLPPG